MNPFQTTREKKRNNRQKKERKRVAYCQFSTQQLFGLMPHPFISPSEKEKKYDKENKKTTGPRWPNHRLIRNFGFFFFFYYLFTLLNKLVLHFIFLYFTF